MSMRIGRISRILEKLSDDVLAGLMYFGTFRQCDVLALALFRNG
jgi:hypothetical protein